MLRVNRMPLVCRCPLPSDIGARRGALHLQFSHEVLQIMDTHEIYIILATFFAPIVAGLVPMWLTKPRFALRWVVLTPKSMFHVAQEITDKLHVTFGETNVTNLTKFSFIIHNCGRESIGKPAILEPFTWTAPGRILDARRIDGNVYVKLNVSHSDRVMEVEWKLFNQDCQAMIEVICDSETDGDSGSVDFQIERIKECRTKNIRVVDEEEIRRRIQRNWSQVPKLLRFGLSVWERVSIFLAIHVWRIVAIYSSFYLGIMCGLVSDLYFGVSSQFIGWIVLSSSLSLSIVSLILLRNPYASLARRTSQSVR
jgi:hypothetical protein